MNSHTLAILTAGCMGMSAVASPIIIVVPGTPALQSVQFVVSGGNDEGDHTRLVNLGGGLSRRSAAQNAQSFADRINSDPDRVATATIDPATPGSVKISPMTGASEPKVRLKLASALNCPIIGFERDPRAGTPDMDEIGYIALGDFTSTAHGNGVVGLSCGTFRAEVMTTAGMSGGKVITELAGQLSMQGAMFQMSSDSLMLCGLGPVSSWTTDVGLNHSITAGSLVPTPGAGVLAGFGAVLCIRRRR